MILPCLACRQRRLQVLRELETFLNIYGAYVPQCSGDGRYYDNKQCMSGTNECWCVTKYGERIAPSLAKSFHELDCDEMARNYTTERPNVKPVERPKTTIKPRQEFQVETDEIEERTTTTPKKVSKTTTTIEETTSAEPTTTEQQHKVIQGSIFYLYASFTRLPINLKFLVPRRFSSSNASKK